MKDVSLDSGYYTKEILNELTPHTSTVNVPKRQNNVVLRGYLDILTCTDSVDRRFCTVVFPDVLVEIDKLTDVVFNS